MQESGFDVQSMVHCVRVRGWLVRVRQAVKYHVTLPRQPSHWWCEGESIVESSDLQSPHGHQPQPSPQHPDLAPCLPKTSTKKNQLGVPSEASKGGLGKKRAAKGPFQLLQQVAAFRDRGPIAYGRGQPQRCSAAARLHTVFRGRVSV